MLSCLCKNQQTFCQLVPCKHSWCQFQGRLLLWQQNNGTEKTKKHSLRIRGEFSLFSVGPGHPREIARPHLAQHILKILYYAKMLLCQCCSAIAQIASSTPPPPPPSTISWPPHHYSWPHPGHPTEKFLATPLLRIIVSANASGEILTVHWHTH